MGPEMTKSADIDRNAEDASDGYTIIELLVALILTSAIATMIGGVITQLRPLKQIEEKYELQRQLDAVAEVMARDIEGALPLPLLDQGPDTQIPMIGAVNSIRFVAVVKTGFQQEGLREITYRLTGGEAGTKKLVREARMRRFGRQTTVESVGLFDRLQQWGLRYFSQDNDAVWTWRNEYAEPNELPKSVAVALKTMDNGQPEATRFSILSSFQHTR